MARPSAAGPVFTLIPECGLWVFYAEPSRRTLLVTTSVPPPFRVRLQAYSRLPCRLLPLLVTGRCFSSLTALLRLALRRAPMPMSPDPLVRHYKACPQLPTLCDGTQRCLRSHSRAQRTCWQRACRLAAKRAKASCGLLASRHTLSWAGLAIRQAAGDATLPPPCASDLGDDTSHSGLSACQLLEPFLPRGAFESAAAPASPALSRSRPADARTGVLCLTVATFNVLSLGPRAEEDDGSLQVEEGLAYRPGRAPLLAGQLAAHDVQAICLQETRAEPGFCKVGG